MPPLTWPSQPTCSFQWSEMLVWATHDLRHVCFYCMVVKGTPQHTGLVWVNLSIVACTQVANPVYLKLWWCHDLLPASFSAVDKNFISEIDRSFWPFKLFTCNSNGVHAEENRREGWSLRYLLSDVLDLRRPGPEAKCNSYHVSVQYNPAKCMVVGKHRLPCT